MTSGSQDTSHLGNQVNINIQLSITAIWKKLGGEGLPVRPCSVFICVAGGPRPALCQHCFSEVRGADSQPGIQTRHLSVGIWMGVRISKSKQSPWVR